MWDRSVAAEATNSGAAARYDIAKPTGSQLHDIGESDAYGLTVIDGIFRGGQCFNQMEGMVFSAGFKDAFWPFGGLLQGPGVVGTLFDMTQAGTTMIGQLASAMARALVLTAVAQTPAAVIGTQTLSASLGLLAAQFCRVTRAGNGPTLGNTARLAIFESEISRSGLSGHHPDEDRDG